MARRKQNQFEVAYGTTALSLTANEDESIRVRGFYSSGASTAHMQATIGQRVVADFRVAGALGNHLPFPAGATTAGPFPPGNLLDLCVEKGWNRGYPIPTGHTMTWTGPNAAGSVNAVLYDTYDAGDVSRSEPNGPESSELDYVIYGSPTTTIATAATTAINTRVSTAEFDAFPFGADVPGRTTITVFGILASTFAPSENDGTNDISTKQLKVVRNQTTLFDKDLTGLPMWQALGTQSADQIGVGAGGNFSTTDRRQPLIFPEPMVFESGEELTFSWVTQIAGTGANMLVADAEIGLICRAVRS